MAVLNETLIRKKSEHNDGLLSELEEISLHQLEIEKIENIDSLCRNLRILLLQNNIISRMENLKRLKSLEYLNLAINNITLIENIAGCESLRKLDLTLNFIDVGNFDASLNNLSNNYNLVDLYLTGNPVCSWASYRDFVVASLPQLRQLDGTLIYPVEKEEAVRRLPDLKVALSDHEAFTPSTASRWSREARTEMYRELASARGPRDPSLPLTPHGKKAPSPVLCASGEVRQCNEGGYKFRLDEYASEGKVVFELETPRFMDVSLIEVDVQPLYVRCVVKGKVTQVRFESEVVVSGSVLTRSKTTGWLHLEAPLLEWKDRGECEGQSIPDLERIPLDSLPIHSG